MTIITYNSARFIRRCLEHLLKQDYADVETIVIDNASCDGTRDILKDYETRLRITYNADNAGFASGQNQAIRLSRGDWVLALNPDVRLMPDFITKMVAAGESDESIGSVSGKLLAMPASFEIPTVPILDSAGIYFTPSLRHFDRGSKRSDDGRYDRPEYVFGVTGAAALYRRTMIEDISINGEFFDEDFFAYREDADVAWRAQLLGWKCLYTPYSIAYHVRSVLPSNRSSVAPILNMHSVKNRFLMRIKNVTAPIYFRHFFAITVRDVMVLGACLLREHSSLRAFPALFRNLRRTLTTRQKIMSRRRVTNEYLGAWFSNTPASFPASEIAARMQATSAVSR